MKLFSTLAAPPDFALPIVDAHHHLWDLRAGHYPSKQDQYDPDFSWAAIARSASTTCRPTMSTR